MVIYISLFSSSLLSLPATKTLGMAFRYSWKLKTCDWEETCLKYMSWNMRSDSWALSKSRNLSNSSCLLDQIFIWICIIHFKSELLKWRLKSIFHEWIISLLNEVKAWTGLTANSAAIKRGVLEPSLYMYILLCLRVVLALLTAEERALEERVARSCKVHILDAGGFDFVKAVN